MDYENFGALDASIQEEVDADSDFQSTLTDLSDEDKESAVKTRKGELLDEKIKTLSFGSKKDKELADNYKIRAEKAEKELKDKKIPGKEGTSETKDMSAMDIIAVTKANVHEDDIQEVVDYAKFKNVSIAEALKSDVIKTTLADRIEKRKTADITNTRTARPSTHKVSGEELVKGLSEGKIPERGTPEAEALFWAKRGGRK